ncbi:MAG: glycosyltransferase family A protein [Acidobacteriota bacterium]
MSPRVTVLMPVFNRERFIDEAVRSVVGQDFSDFELLIVDDGSTDRTPEILSQWAQRDPRIVVITSPRNQGIPAALNLGLRNARAPYVARLDSDDVMMPGRISAQAAVLDALPEVVLVASQYETMDGEGNYLDTWRGDEPHEVVTYLLNFYNIVGGGGQVMFRRSEVLAMGGYSLDYPSSEDYDLWVRLLRRGRILTLPMIGMKQRDHNARSHVLYGSAKRANWTAIMSGSLGRYLGRPIRAEEIAALITVWRLEGETGRAGTADRTMREAFDRFRSEHRDPALRRCVRGRIARQWMQGAANFARAGQRTEAMRYRLRAAGWSPITAMGLDTVRPNGALEAALRRSGVGRLLGTLKRTAKRLCGS